MFNAAALCAVALALLYPFSQAGAGQFTVRVRREFERHFWVIPEYTVEINGVRVGTVGNSETRDFFVPLESTENVIRIVRNSGGSQSELISLQAQSGDVFHATFAANDGTFPLDVQYMGNEELARKGNRGNAVIRVRRKHAWTLGWPNYNVYINGKHVGGIKNNSVMDFIVPIPVDEPNTIYIEIPDSSWESKSTVVPFETNEDGDMVDVEFVGAFGIVPVKISEARNENRERTQRERERHAALTSTTCLAPKWFKQSIKEALPNVNADVRDSYLSSIVQCEAVTRMCAFVVMLWPAYGWAVYRMRNAKQRQSNAMPSIFLPALMMLLTIPLSIACAFVINLGVYAIMGSGPFVPFQFVLWCILCVMVLAGVAMSAVPLKRLTMDGEPSKRVWGVAGIVWNLVAVMGACQDVVGWILMVVKMSAK